MPACAAQARAPAPRRAGRRGSPRGRSGAGVSGRAGSRFLLISWMTPITSPHRRQHRHGQHRAGAVAGLVVEAAVVAEASGSSPASGARPRSGMLIGCPREHRLADDRLVVDGERELLEVDLDRVVLRQHEVEPLADDQAAVGDPRPRRRRRCPRRRRSPGGTSPGSRPAACGCRARRPARARWPPAPPARSGTGRAAAWSSETLTARDYNSSAFRIDADWRPIWRRSLAGTARRRAAS